ncbi:MAG: diacylglycerol kinase family lipid kinase [Candidatus Zixiibacteriota bacterium]|nr:MAG: diacylglycerol kinase family lipid kinase [candidate division Zixibacteria bacterium]
MKIKAIINTESGNGHIDRYRSVLVDKLRRHLVDLEHTCRKGHATEIARAAVRRGIDTLVVAGGDGTVNEVLNGIMGSDTALGIVPLGTANDLAESLNIPSEIEKACEVILNGNVRHSDVIRVNNWHYLTVGGIGLPSHALAITEAIRKRRQLGKWMLSVLGSKIYILAALMALARRSQRLGISAGGLSDAISSYSLLIGNQRFLGRDFQVLPGARGDDGVFDVFLIKDLGSRLRLAGTVLKTLSASHVSRPDAVLFQGKRLQIRSWQPVAFCGDGEIREKAWDFDIEVVPRAVKVLAPPEAAAGRIAADNGHVQDEPLYRHRVACGADY